MIKILFLSLILSLITIPVVAQLSSSPDAFDTNRGELTVHPINHGSIAFTFDELTIFVDPFGGAELFSDFDEPDIVFITDIHGDHLNPETLASLDTENTIFVVPQAVADQMEVTGAETIIIGNGESTEVRGIPVSAIPMYNLPENEESRHPKGRGNGYIIGFGGETVYISGDTEDIPEMRNLEGIDIAFVCMNLPYTMDISQAAEVVTEFQPKIVYPYHHRGQDIEEFKNLVDAENVDVEVKLKDWYLN